MPEINIPKILVDDYKFSPLEITYYNHKTVDKDTQTFKIARRADHSNALIQINPTELVDENT